MLLETYLPRLTIAEAERCWMQAIDVCELAAIGEVHRPETRKFLANISDRGYVDFVKSGEGKTSPKLYSLKSAIMLSAFRFLTDMQHSYEFAQPIAAKVYEVSAAIIQSLDQWLDIEESDWIVSFRADYKGNAVGIQVLRSSELTAAKLVAAHPPAGGYLGAGCIAFNILRRYGDFWARDRAKHRVDGPPGRYDGCDANGYPLDPNHPWNKNKSPLEYARRLVEIEEFIASSSQKKKRE